MSNNGEGLFLKSMNLGCGFVIFLILTFFILVFVVPHCAPKVTSTEETTTTSSDTAGEAETEKASPDPYSEYVKNNLIFSELQTFYKEKFGKQEVCVKGTIINTGEKTLVKVKIRAFFQDKYGQTISEKAYYPVFATELGFADSPPLRPGYQQDFEYNLSADAPSNWGGASSVSIAFAAIEFAK